MSGRQALVLAAVVAALASVLACGTEAKGVEACKRIERIRCETAAACGIDLKNPVHRGDTPSDDVGACIRYYDDACLHGLTAAIEPGSVAVDDCVRALENGSCDVIRAPETTRECSFLVPVAEPAPAPVTTDASTADAAATDGG
jgi:hypothetical protein